MNDEVKKIAFSKNILKVTAICLMFNTDVLTSSFNAVRNEISVSLNKNRKSIRSNVCSCVCDVAVAVASFENVIMLFVSIFFSSHTFLKRTTADDAVLFTHMLADCLESFIMLLMAVSNGSCFPFYFGNFVFEFDWEVISK